MVIFDRKGKYRVMKKFQIVHNPTAGGATYVKTDLLKQFKKVQVDYVSTDDENWESFYKNSPDLVYVAGGDGTIGRTAKVLLKHCEPQQRPVLSLLPIGTANNVAKTFRITKNSSFSTENDNATFLFDSGRIKGISDEDFFLESVGFGVFPDLISEMKKRKIANEPPSEKLQRTLTVMLEIIKKFKARKATIKVNGIKIKGAFLLLELMNIKAVGPCIEVAPKADPGDGYFDLIMIPEKRRPELKNFIQTLIELNSTSPISEEFTITSADMENFATRLRVKKLKIKSKASSLHIDDNLVKDYTGSYLKIKVIPGALKIARPSS